MKQVLMRKMTDDEYAHTATLNEQASIGLDIWDYINVWNRNKRRRELESKRTSENILRQGNRARNRRQRKARRIERMNRK